ncbi:hypothetical protein J1N35_014372 [Gossypium stocksii]|uniref:FAM91 N-terminal domain-containing protein n=1 Tax=Gossypium stocksii TaxID=47602 RepID=A0A9D3VVX7_9ROSI|nr:hypothetical protein J1N35_014372 [Gossypium stocksii]
MLSSDGSDNHPQSVAGVGWYILGEDQQNVGPYAIFELREQPYDSITNFTGIGRNEFIDIMNKCRSKKIIWKLNKSIAKELLPTQPVDFQIEPWCGICLVNFTLEESKKKKWQQ